MAARHARFVRSTLTPAEQTEADVVDGIANRLEEYLAGHTVEIDDVHVFRASSAKVQDVVGGLLREVGFREEVVHTPQAGFVTRSRADFAYRLGEGRGVIAEIERGGTTTNNHDLKDFWNRHRGRRPPPVPGRADGELEGERRRSRAAVPPGVRANRGVLRRSEA